MPYGQKPIITRPQLTLSNHRSMPATSILLSNLFPHTHVQIVEGNWDILLNTKDGIVIPVKNMHNGNKIGPIDSPFFALKGTFIMDDIY